MPGSQLHPTILDALAVLLDAVTGVQRVYTYQPIAVAPGQIPTVMGSNQAIDFWSVVPESSESTRLTGYQHETNHVVLFQHSYTIGDSSVTTPLLRVILQAVFDKFTNTFAIVPQAEMTGPPALTWPVPWMLAESFLVWRTEFRLPVKELYTTQ